MERKVENGVAREMHTSAVSAVSGVYEEYFINPGLRLARVNPYDALLQVASEHPVYTSQIQALSLCLQTAEEIKRAYNKSFEGFGHAFGWKTSPPAKRLLINILLARTAESSSRLRQVNIFAEAEVMASEMGLEGDITSGTSLDISTNQVISDVLLGKLQMPQGIS